MESKFTKSYRALLFDELEEYLEYIDSLTSYIREQADNPVDAGSNTRHALNNRAVACWEIGKIDLAISDLTAAVTGNTSDYVPLHNLGDIYLKNNEYAKAIELYSRAIEIDPGEVSSFRLRAYACMEAGKWYDAIQDFDQAILLDPGWKQTWLDRARAKEKIGDLDGAAKDRQSASEL